MAKDVTFVTYRLFFRQYLCFKIIEMNWNEYVPLFEDILTGKITGSPYDDPHFMEYVKLNKSRMNRWLKTGKLNDDLKLKLAAIHEPQYWNLITEPWCGDAAHSNPFIFLMSDQNPHIHLQIQLRDSDSEIDLYLTNGGKSIPKLIVRDENGNDIWVWGPRPKEAQQYVLDLKSQELSIEEQKAKHQEWYNQDKGAEIQREFLNWLSQK